ncbi:hypothetical protein BDZ88DRAFT_488805 [Geranomyces variabilis]|nr:hypothetical protein BDZ88DRAFT_488805 [Geranomyces variabilis]
MASGPNERRHFVSANDNSFSKPASDAVDAAEAAVRAAAVAVEGAGAALRAAAVAVEAAEAAAAIDHSNPPSVCLASPAPAEIRPPQTHPSATTTAVRPPPPSGSTARPPRPPPPSGFTARPPRPPPPPPPSGSAARPPRPSPPPRYQATARARPASLSMRPVSAMCSDWRPQAACGTCRAPPHSMPTSALTTHAGRHRKPKAMSFFGPAEFAGNVGSLATWKPSLFGALSLSELSREWTGLVTLSWCTSTFALGPDYLPATHRAQQAAAKRLRELHLNGTALDNVNLIKRAIEGMRARCAALRLYRNTDGTAYIGGTLSIEFVRRHTLRDATLCFEHAIDFDREQWTSLDTLLTLTFILRGMFLNPWHDVAARADFPYKLNLREERPIALRRRQLLALDHKNVPAVASRSKVPPMRWSGRASLRRVRKPLLPIPFVRPFPVHASSLVRNFSFGILASPQLLLLDPHNCPEGGVADLRGSAAPPAVGRGHNVSLFVDFNQQRYDVKVKLMLNRNAVFTMAPGSTVHIDEANGIVVLDNVFVIVESVDNAGHWIQDLGVHTPVVAVDEHLALSVELENLRIADSSSPHPRSNSFTGFTAIVNEQATNDQHLALSFEVERLRIADSSSSDPCSTFPTGSDDDGSTGDQSGAGDQSGTADRSSPTWSIGCGLRTHPPPTLDSTPPTESADDGPTRPTGFTAIVNEQATIDQHLALHSSWRSRANALGYEVEENRIAVALCQSPLLTLPGKRLDPNTLHAKIMELAGMLNASKLVLPPPAPLTKPLFFNYESKRIAPPRLIKMFEQCVARITSAGQKLATILETFGKTEYRRALPFPLSSSLAIEHAATVRLGLRTARSAAPPSDPSSSRSLGSRGDAPDPLHLAPNQAWWKVELAGDRERCDGETWPWTISAEEADKLYEQVFVEPLAPWNHYGDLAPSTPPRESASAHPIVSTSGVRRIGRQLARNCEPTSKRYSERHCFCGDAASASAYLPRADLSPALHLLRPPKPGVVNKWQSFNRPAYEQFKVKRELLRQMRPEEMIKRLKSPIKFVFGGYQGGGETSFFQFFLLRDPSCARRWCRGPTNSSFSFFSASFSGIYTQPQLSLGNSAPRRRSSARRTQTGGEGGNATRNQALEPASARGHLQQRDKSRRPPSQPPRILLRNLLEVKEVRQISCRERPGVVKLLCLAIGITTALVRTAVEELGSRTPVDGTPRRFKGQKGHAVSEDLRLERGRHIAYNNAVVRDGLAPRITDRWAEPETLLAGRVGEMAAANCEAARGLVLGTAGVKRIFLAGGGIAEERARLGSASARSLAERAIAESLAFARSDPEGGIVEERARLGSAPALLAQRLGGDISKELRRAGIGMVTFVSRRRNRRGKIVQFRLQCLFFLNDEGLAVRGLQAPHRGAHLSAFLNFVPKLKPFCVLSKLWIVLISRTSCSSQLSNELDLKPLNPWFKRLRTVSRKMVRPSFSVAILKCLQNLTGFEVPSASRLRMYFCTPNITAPPNAVVEKTVEMRWVKPVNWFTTRRAQFKSSDTRWRSLSIPGEQLQALPNPLGVHHNHLAAAKRVAVSIRDCLCGLGELMLLATISSSTKLGLLKPPHGQYGAYFLNGVCEKIIFSLITLIPGWGRASLGIPAVGSWAISKYFGS